MTLAGRRVVLGVSGGIACYKACTLARRLTEAGADVQVIMTASALEFVGPVTFEALTGQPVVTSLWSPGSALDHVRLARDVDLIVVAPATAHLIARAAQGLADDFLPTVLLAATAPVLLAPAMNDDMYDHPATARNIGLLRERGWHIVGPVTGSLAEGPSDRPGRMVEPEDLFEASVRIIRAQGSPWAGMRVLVTAGPTREELDPVRVVTNRASGRMGYALARAAYARGADVTLITGPGQLPVPYGVEVQEVESTDELRDAVAVHLPNADVLIMAAAPADYRPRDRADEKRPRAGGTLTVKLEPTDDILETTRDRRKSGAVVIGFALEIGDGRKRAREKLARKGLDLIVLNHADQAGAGFEAETNAVTILGDDGTELSVPLLPKAEVAERILETAEPRL